MPAPGQTIEDAAELLDFDCAESRRLINERSRTDSDKTNLGIPAGRDDYPLGSNNDFDSWTGLTSAGQASHSQKSWGTMSATSHGTLHSSQDLDYLQYSQPIGTNAPHIIVNSSSAQSMSENTGFYATSNADHSMYDPWTQDYWQASAGSSNPIQATSGTMAFAPKGIFPGASWMGDIALANMIGPDLAPNNFVASAEQEFAQAHSSAEMPAGYQHPYQDFEKLNIAETVGDSLQPAMEFSSASDTSCLPALSNPNVLSVDLHHLQKGADKGLAARQRYNKRRRPNVPKRKDVDKINMVRSVGACIRCAILKEKCDLGDPCAKCKTNAQKARIWKQPCVRINLTDAQIHRTGALSFPEGFRKLTWVSKERVVLSLYNVGFAPSPVPPSSRPNLQVVCRGFRAANGEPLSKSWISNGRRCDIQLPAYAIPPSYQKDLNTSFDALLGTQFHKLSAELECGQDKIIAMTLAEAIRHEGKCAMLKKALSIAIMTRLSMKSFNITGPQTLGIPQVDDTESPYYGRIPIPPVLDAQLDHLWIGKMNGLRKNLLSQLKKWIENKSKRRENWFTIFLTIIILLSNLELVYQQQVGQRRRYAKTNPLQERMMESWQHAAKTLIAYFHAICHGGVPLEMDWDEEAQEAANLDGQSLQFLSALKALVASRVDELRKRATEPPHTPLVWIAALLLGGSQS